MVDIRAVSQLVCREKHFSSIIHDRTYFFCVILSDEGAVATGSRRNPLAAGDPRFVAVPGDHTVIRAVIGVLRCAQDDTLTFMNDPAERPLYPR